jgi:uncharacterized protein
MRVRGSVEIPYTFVADVCRAHPDRFSGLAGIDPTNGMQRLRELERTVKEYGFVGALWYPHWSTAPDVARSIRIMPNAARSTFPS